LSWEDDIEAWPGGGVWEGFLIARSGSVFRCSSPKNMKFWWGTLHSVHPIPKIQKKLFFINEPPKRAGSGFYYTKNSETQITYLAS
jgi:hypothetical protein